MRIVSAFLIFLLSKRGRSCRKNYVPGTTDKLLIKGNRHELEIFVKSMG